MQSSASPMMVWDANTMGMIPQPVMAPGQMFGAPQLISGEPIHVLPAQPQMMHDGQGIVWIQPQPYAQRQEEEVSYQLPGLVPGQIPCMNQSVVMVSALPGQHMAQLPPNQDFQSQQNAIRTQTGYYHSAEPMRQIIQTADGMQYIAICPETQPTATVQAMNTNTENFPPTRNMQVFDERPILTPRRRNGFNNPNNTSTKGPDSLSWRRKGGEKTFAHGPSVALRRRSQSPAEIIGVGESALSDSIIPTPNKRLAPLLSSHTYHQGPAPSDVIEAYNSDIWRAPDHRNLGKLLDVIEYYFSDDSLVKNGYMLKQISGKSDGFVSIKKVASLKRIKQITRDIRTIVYSIRHSTKLELSEDGLMVRRKKPLPDNIETPRFIRSILAINLPTDNPSVEDVTSWFAEYGELTQVRILRPGKPLPSYLKDYTSWVPDLGNQYCAVVEFESQDEAQKACREINMKNRERFNLRVALLKPGARIRRTLYRKYKETDDKVTSAEKENVQNKNCMLRRNRCYSQSSDGSEQCKEAYNPKEKTIGVDCKKTKPLRIDHDYDASESGSDTCSGSDSDYSRVKRENLKNPSSWKTGGSHSDSGYSHSSGDERDHRSGKMFKSKSISPPSSRKSSISEKNFVDGIPVGVLRQPKGPIDDSTKGFETKYRVIDAV